nr:heavy metal translocating P-type ATPase [Phascolarctobacterium succinatutens]
MKKDLEDIRNGAGDVRAFRHIDGHINSVEDYSKHPEGCTCGHCGKDHDHKTMGHVPKHTHGDACGCGHDYDHEHEEHSHEHGDDCCCGNEHEHNHEHEHEHVHAHSDECGCGHDHEHAHAHGDECGCGHDHGHEHEHAHEHSHTHGDKCGCGHDHEHEHEHVHAHGDECGCGHDHEHEEHEHAHAHGDACGCGHDHGHEEHEHAHAHGDACGCGHDHEHEEYEHAHAHGDACGCGHDHEHEHEHAHAHGDACGCGHDHGHEHAHVHGHHVPGHPADCNCEICHPHEEYCDVCGESLANCTCRMPDADKIKRVYILQNLGCANCAAKMEYKIKELPGVTYANVSFATKQLRLSAADHEALLPEIQKICTSIESDVVVVPRDRRPQLGGKSRVYLVQNLDCANCGAKIERALNAMPEIDEATLTFTTKKLRVSAKDYNGLLEKMQAVTDKVEEGVVLLEAESKPSLAPELEERKKSGGILSELSEKQTIIEIVLGGAVFIITEWLGLVPEAYHMYFLIFAYILLGGRIVLTALKNIAKGNVFDENFLMTVATLGAFAIQAWEEAVGVMFFYRVGEYFEQRAVEKSRGQIMDAVDLRPEVVNLLVGEEVKVIPAADAHVGDILLVRVGDRIPLDGVVIDGESLVDTSPVTGEPVPVKRKYGDEVVSGCVNTSGMLKIRVEKVLEESMVTRILDSVENAAASKPTIDRFITRFARIYTPFVVAAAVLTAVIPSLITGDWNKWIYTALTFLVISCPCALVLSVPLAFFSGIGAGSKYGILFKGGVAMEALKNIAAVVMDKTGTVTKGNFVLQKVNAAEGMNADELLRLCASAELVSTHPIAVSIVEAAKAEKLELVRPDKFEEIAGEGLVAYFGARKVLCGNTKLLQRFNVEYGGYTPTESGSEVLVADNGLYMGQLLINDTLKEDAKEAIASLKAQGLVTAMLTGDAQKEAQAVAKEAGIDEVRAQLLPQDKLSELNMLRNKYGPVMFVGDGINDAPVLAGADAGAAMGSGADAAIEAADVVFMNSEVKAIPQAIAIARATGAIAWQNVIFALTVKVIIMIAGLMGYASMWAAVFADTGVSLLCVLNSIRILYKKI